MVDFMFHLEILEAIPTYSTTVYLDLLDLVPAVVSKQPLIFLHCRGLLQGKPSEQKVSQAGCMDRLDFRFPWGWKYIRLVSHGESRMNN